MLPVNMCNKDFSPYNSSVVSLAVIYHTKLPNASSILMLRPLNYPECCSGPAIVRDITGTEASFLEFDCRLRKHF